MIAGAVGLVTGGIAPDIATSFPKAALLGAGANTTQYALTQVVHGNPIDGVGVGMSAIVGGFGGFVGGPVTSINHPHWQNGYVYARQFRAANLNWKPLHSLPKRLLEQMYRFLAIQNYFQEVRYIL